MLDWLKAPGDCCVRGSGTDTEAVLTPSALELGLLFEPIGVYRRIGWKHGQVARCRLLQRTITTGQDRLSNLGDLARGSPALE